MIQYKLIERERFGDAPFVGCLISSIGCNLNCIGCFNQHLKDSLSLLIDKNEFIKMVKDNPFEEGIIFAGLEWSEQPNELLQLMDLAYENDLKIMIYTGLGELDFHKRIQIKNIPNGSYIKFGKYNEELKTNDNVQFGVKLASSNQYIKFYKK